MNYYSRPAVNYQKPRIDDLIDKVVNHFCINSEDLKSKKRFATINESRSILMYLIHKHCGKSSTETGKIFNRDHSTVLHACKKIEGFMEFDKDYKQLVNKFI
jgi:chromosomal replication initiator protein